jgi:hypothetical protein
MLLRIMANRSANFTISQLSKHVKDADGFFSHLRTIGWTHEINVRNVPNGHPYPGKSWADVCKEENLTLLSE